jgi:hypothetical protein
MDIKANPKYGREKKGRIPNSARCGSSAPTAAATASRSL